MPPWLISVVNPGTVISEMSFAVMMRTGSFTGCRGQRLVFGGAIFISVGVHLQEIESAA